LRDHGGSRERPSQEDDRRDRDVPSNHGAANAPGGMQPPGPNASAIAAPPKLTAAMFEVP
jgi:hypothetical protein